MNGSRSTPIRRRLRLIALAVAVIGVLALAAAAFVLSYPGARDTVLTTGVSKNLARIYPGIFDAVLVVACAAALTLRGILRAYAWLAILVITAAIAAADATHAMSVTLPKRPMEATVAAVPWAVLLVGFTLLYAMARQKRPSKTPAPAAPTLATIRTVPLSELLKAKPGQGQPSPTPPSAEPADSTPTSPATTTHTEPATTPAEPATTTLAEPATTTLAEPAASAPPKAAESTPAETPPSEVPVAALPPLPRRRAIPRDEPSDADTESPEPVIGFNRLHSSPIPPGDDD